MTIATIRAQLTTKLNALALTYGEGAVLSPSDNTTCTDQLAKVLETVNPNHNYPPTPR